MESTSKGTYITLISKQSDHYGDKLLAMMDEFHARSLQELSYGQVKTFYETRCTA